jgi:hypothetical protein
VVAGSTVVGLNRPGGSVPPRQIAAPAAAAQQPAAAEEPVVDNGAGKPVSTSLHSLDIAPAGNGTVTVAKRGTKPFSLLGLTWSDPKLAVAATVQVRTRAAKSGTWSPWQTLETTGTRGPDTGAESKRDVRGGSEPLWVGPSDGVAARIVKTLYRQAIWSKNLAAGKHTVAVVVLATSGRPGVTVDGLSYVK